MQILSTLAESPVLTETEDAAVSNLRNKNFHLKTISINVRVQKTATAMNPIDMLSACRDTDKLRMDTGYS